MRKFKRIIVVVGMLFFCYQVNGQSACYDISCPNVSNTLNTADCPSLATGGAYTNGIGVLPTGTPQSQWIGFHAGVDFVQNEAFAVNYGARLAGTYTIGFYSATAYDVGAVASSTGRFSVKRGSTVIATVTKATSPTQWVYLQYTFSHPGGSLTVEFDGTANGANTGTSGTMVSYTHISDLKLSLGSTIPATCCDAGTAAPVLSTTTASSICPATTVDLTAITASNTPIGNTSLTWHTATPATTANLVTDATMVVGGTYYAAFYDTSNFCYSGGNGSATTVVTVTTAPCCNASSDPPIFN